MLTELTVQQAFSTYCLLYFVQAHQIS